MIKIIKKGKKEDYISTCKDCGCEFQYSKWDIKREDRLDDTLRQTWFVRCPFCNSLEDFGRGERTLVKEENE